MNKALFTCKNCGEKFFEKDANKVKQGYHYIISCPKCGSLRPVGTMSLDIGKLVEEETKPEPKFKVGDKVKWYNHTCDITSIDTNENTYTYLIMYDDCREDKIFVKWVPESELTVEDDEETKSIDFTIKATDTKGKVEVVIPEGYGYVVENDKLYFITKKKEYPKTYEECCKVLDIDDRELVFNGEYRASKLYWKQLGRLNILNKLLICRDAYWKLYGEEKGLEKPWEPDWESETELKYTIVVDANKVCKGQTVQINTILSFPTEEMRDAFYENFKSEIESCKELL